MILPELTADLRRLMEGVAPPMLMLGAQDSTCGASASVWFSEFVGEQYEEIDLRDGDLQLDLNRDLADLAERYGAVFNLGTLEHVWNIHAAYCNALRAVKVGGHFLTSSPVGGWRDDRGLLDHGLHMTAALAIVEFVQINGFSVEDKWITALGDRGSVLWMKARKDRHVPAIESFACVYQLEGRRK